MMKRLLKTALVLAIALGAFTSSSAGERVVKMRKLDSGLTIIASPNPWNQIVGFTAVVDAGTRRDPKGIEGLSHLTNELMERGVKSMTHEELSEILDLGGMYTSTYSSLDWVSIEVSSMRSEMDAAARVFAAVLTEPLLDQTDLISVQADALRRIEKSGGSSVDEAIADALSVLFGDHPYGRPTVGTRESIEAATVKDVNRFYEKNYGSDGTVVAVVGDFEPDYALDLLEDLLSEYGEREAEPTRSVPVKRQKARTIDQYRDIEKGAVVAAYLTPDLKSKDAVSLRLASLILAGGEHTRLGRVFDDSSTAGVYMLDGRDAGAFVVYARTDDIEPTRAKLDQELERLRTELVTEEELDRAKNTYLVRLAAAKEKNSRVALSLAADELLGLGVEYEVKLMSRVDAVTREDVLQASQRNLVEPVVVIQRSGKKRTRGGI